MPIFHSIQISSKFCMAFLFVRFMEKLSAQASLRTDKNQFGASQTNNESLKYFQQHLQPKHTSNDIKISVEESFSVHPNWNWRTWTAKEDIKGPWINRIWPNKSISDWICPTSQFRFQAAGNDHFYHKKRDNSQKDRLSSGDHGAAGLYRRAPWRLWTYWLSLYSFISWLPCLYRRSCTSLRALLFLWGPLWLSFGLLFFIIWQHVRSLPNGNQPRSRSITGNTHNMQHL